MSVAGSKRKRTLQLNILTSYLSAYVQALAIAISIVACARMLFCQKNDRDPAVSYRHASAYVRVGKQIALLYIAIPACCMPVPAGRSSTL